MNAKQAYDMSLESLEKTAIRMYIKYGREAAMAQIKVYKAQNVNNIKGQMFWTEVEQKLAVLGFDREKVGAKAMMMVQKFGGEAEYQSLKISDGISTLTGKGEKFWEWVAKASAEMWAEKTASESKMKLNAYTPSSKTKGQLKYFGRVFSKSQEQASLSL